MQSGAVYAKRSYGLRCGPCSRAAFQIWPHAVQRQYVESLISLLVVVTFGEWQKGQASHATVASVDCGGMYTSRSSVDPARQEIPVARLADKKRRARAVRRWTRLGSGHGDKVRHLRDRSG